MRNFFLLTAIRPPRYSTISPWESALISKAISSGSSSRSSHECNADALCNTMYTYESVRLLIGNHIQDQKRGLRYIVRRAAGTTARLSCRRSRNILLRRLHIVELLADLC